MGNALTEACCTNSERTINTVFSPRTQKYLQPENNIYGTRNTKGYDSDSDYQDVDGAFKAKYQEKLYYTRNRQEGAFLQTNEELIERKKSLIKKQKQLSR